MVANIQHSVVFYFENRQCIQQTSSAEGYLCVAVRRDGQDFFSAHNSSLCIVLCRVYWQLKVPDIQENLTKKFIKWYLVSNTIFLSLVLLVWLFFSKTMAEFSTSLMQTPHNISFFYVRFMFYFSWVLKKLRAILSVIVEMEMPSLQGNRLNWLTGWRDRNISLFPCRNVVSKSMCWMYPFKRRNYIDRRSQVLAKHLIWVVPGIIPCRRWSSQL